MKFQIRQLSTADYPFVISVIDQRWGGRQMADKLPRLVFEHFTGTSFAAPPPSGRSTHGAWAGPPDLSAPGHGIYGVPQRARGWRS